MTPKRLADVAPASNTSTADTQGAPGPRGPTADAANTTTSWLELTGRVKLFETSGVCGLTALNEEKDFRNLFDSRVGGGDGLSAESSFRLADCPGLLGRYCVRLVGLMSIWS